MIPKVRPWNVRILDDSGNTVALAVVDAPTKFLARLNFRHEFFQYWGKSIRISPVRKSV